MSKRELKKEARRNDIVHTAFYRFASEGYHQVQMIDISRDLGIGHGTLYRYFEDKDALFTAVVKSEIALFEEGFVGDTLEKRSDSAHRLWRRSAPLFDACPKGKDALVEEHYSSVEKEMQNHVPTPALWRALVFDVALRQRGTLEEVLQLFVGAVEAPPVAIAKGWK